MFPASEFQLEVPSLVSRLHLHGPSIGFVASVLSVGLVGSSKFPTSGLQLQAPSLYAAVLWSGLVWSGIGGATMPDSQTTGGC